MTHTIAQDTQTSKVLTVSNKNKATSDGLRAVMIKKGLMVTGCAEKDILTCKLSGEFPNWSVVSKDIKGGDDEALQSK